MRDGRVAGGVRVVTIGREQASRILVRVRSVEHRVQVDVDGVLGQGVLADAGIGLLRERDAGGDSLVGERFVGDAAVLENVPITGEHGGRGGAVSHGPDPIDDAGRGHGVLRSRVRSRAAGQLGEQFAAREPGHP